MDLIKPGLYFLYITVIPTRIVVMKSWELIDIGNYNYTDSTRRNSRLRLRHSNWYEGISSDISFDTNEYSLNNTIDLNKTYIKLNILVLMKIEQKVMLTIWKFSMWMDKYLIMRLKMQKETK